jgi:hypothetical protein
MSKVIELLIEAIRQSEFSLGSIIRTKGFGVVLLCVMVAVVGPETLRFVNDPAPVINALSHNAMVFGETYTPIF